MLLDEEQIPSYFVLMAREHSRSILLLDNDETSARDIQRFLKVSAFTFSVSHAGSVQDGADFLKNHQPDIVLLDAGFAELPGYPSVKKILNQYKAPVILLSEAVGGGELKQQAEKVGAVDYLTKNKVNLFNLQKIIINTLKLNETENRLDHAVEEYTARQESFSKILNRVSEGILIINRDNLIRFANEKAYKILGESHLRKDVSGLILYRETDEEEIIELKGNRKHQLLIRISPIDWQGEKANLVILREIQNEKPEQNRLIMEMLTAFLDNVDTSIVLLKNDQISFANRFAAHQLLLPQTSVTKKRLHDIFGSEEALHSSTSLTDFMSERSATGIIKLGDGSTRNVHYTIRYLNVADELYQLMSFEVIEVLPEIEIPRGRTDEDRFSTNDVLHLASHDLREPVRTILNYVQLIADHLSRGKYDEAAEYAGFARQAATRMDTLLSDLKVYIALSDYAFTMNKISMKTLANEVLKTLKVKIAETGATVEVANLPDISADRELVEKLLLHLVDNALKFHRNNNKPIVDISYDKFEGNIIFCVRDNGIGISKKYQSKIFELFERLNRVDEYPGNGLGLAICKKITEMHGGKIWVESVPGAGSNFYFTLRSK